MPSLADIPDAFLAPGLLRPFVEWVKLLPASADTKTELLSLWAAHTKGTISAADITDVRTNGFLTHGQ